MGVRNMCLWLQRLGNDYCIVTMTEIVESQHYLFFVTRVFLNY